jgi:hypothetical protein
MYFKFMQTVRNAFPLLLTCSLNTSLMTKLISAYNLDSVAAVQWGIVCEIHGLYYDGS